MTPDRRQEMREAIEKAGLKPASAAIKAGLHPKTVYDFLSGKRDMFICKTYDKIMNTLKQ